MQADSMSLKSSGMFLLATKNNNNVMSNVTHYGYSTYCVYLVIERIILYKSSV